MQLKINNWTLDFTNNNDTKGVWIDNGWNSQHVIFYELKGVKPWACDFPEQIPQYIRNVLNSVKF